MFPSLSHVSNVSSTRHIDFPIKHDSKTATNKATRRQNDKMTMRANVSRKNVSYSLTKAVGFGVSFVTGLKCLIIPRTHRRTRRGGWGGAVAPPV